MDKILIELYIPASGQVYDVFIPVHLKVFEVEALLISAVTDLTGGYFTAAEDTVLCDRATGEVLDINLSVQELGLQNGSALMLI
ncbi:EsaB/YukD family protein [Paenibacillus tarimensis]|uniref:EsaB/YukD family protein n=1 Tax=Paenibacillus tarimensis TaxID=416012 RepID=UPI001F47AEE3|nr:EsaB/YukD family protein [Paenibacillus tarimensis]MCF2942872.1 EsaB/YukD family protein [Paenibacillus tarimensis]